MVVHHVRGELEPAAIGAFTFLANVDGEDVRPNFNKGNDSLYHRWLMRSNISAGVCSVSSEPKAHVAAARRDDRRLERTRGREEDLCPGCGADLLPASHRRTNAVFGECNSL